MKIILAIDAHDKQTELSPLIYEELKNWCVNIKTDVLPVYVSSQPMESDLVLPKGFEEFAPLKVLFSGRGRRKEADVLIEYAEELGASILAFVSKGLGNQDQKILGSFAEAIVLRSHKPLLFLGESPSSNLSMKSSKVLFMTDFSEASRQALSILMEQLKPQSPEIFIFHALELPSLALAGSVYAQALNLLPASYWADEERKAKVLGEKFVQLAQENGFKAKLILMSKVLSASEAVRRVIAQEQITLVAAVALNNGLFKLPLNQMESNLNKTQPVWICGPRAVNS